MKAHVSWLECKEACIPGSGDVEATLNIGNETKPSADDALIESWKKKVPLTTNYYSLQAWWESAIGDTRPLDIGNPSEEADKNFKYDLVDFFPDASDEFEVQANTEVIDAHSAQLHLRKLVKKFSGDWPKKISGVLVVHLNNFHSGYEVNLPIADNVTTSETISAQTVPESRTGFQPVQAGKMPALLSMLLYAFIGGLILNIMPCVRCNFAAIS